MTILERIGALLRWGERAPTGATAGLRAVIETARTAKLDEDYPRALSALDDALELIKEGYDSAGAVVIFLQKGDIYTRTGDYDAAERALEAARAKAGDQKIQLAYVVGARGFLAFTRGDYDSAHALYEESLAMARETGSSGAEGRAQGMRGQLFLHEGNASYAVHLLREALPKLSAASDIELSPLFLGLLGEASIETGQAGEGVHLIERALSLSEQMRDKASERRWALALGERALQEARLTDARMYLKRAVKLFGDAPTPAHVAALCQLSRVYGLLHTDADAQYAAERAVNLSVGLDDSTRALAEGALGMALKTAGRAREAIPHLQAAVDDTQAPTMDVLRGLTMALADAGEMDAAMTAGQNALAAAEKRGVALDVALAKRNLGLLHVKADRLQEAITLWTGALTLFEAEKAHAQMARLLCDVGNARKLLGMHQRAQRDYEQALTVLNSVDSGDLETRGVVLSSAGNAYAEQGDADSADSFFNEAIALAEKLGDSSAESTRRNNYGYFLVQMGRPRRAITLLEQALVISSAKGYALPQAIQLDNLGLAHDSTGEYSIARDFHQQALAKVETLNQPYWHASIRINLAATLIALGEVDEAAPLTDAALHTARELGQSDLLVRALTTKALAALKVGNYAEAQAALDEAIPLAQRGDLRRWLADAQAVRSELCAAQGDYAAAQTAWAEAARLYTMLRMPQGKRSPAWLQHEKA
jgi:tetratricopeptide (TPR) repeat protein